MATESKRELWIERMAAHAASGLSQKQWCEQNQIALHQLTYWRQRLGMVAPRKQNATVGADGATVEWCGLQVMAGAAASSLSVYIGPARVAVEPGFDAGHLRAVVEALDPSAGPMRRRDATC